MDCYHINNSDLIFIDLTNIWLGNIKKLENWIKEIFTSSKFLYGALLGLFLTVISVFIFSIIINLIDNLLLILSGFKLQSTLTIYTNNIPIIFESEKIIIGPLREEIVKIIPILVVGYAIRKKIEDQQIDLEFKKQVIFFGIASGTIFTVLETYVYVSSTSLDVSVIYQLFSRFFASVHVLTTTIASRIALMSLVMIITRNLNTRELYSALPRSFMILEAIN